MLNEPKAAPVGERDDERAAIHQLAFELGGTEGGEYLLDADDLDAVIDAAYQRQSGVDWRAFSERLMDFITNAQVSSGVCCCGDSMQGHADPMTSGHSPVDVWDNAVFEIGRGFARLNGGHHE